MDDKIFELASRIPVMLLGAPGIGKTAMVTQFANKMGADLVDIRLSAETPSSFEGKDYISPKSGNLMKARAWWLQRIDANRERNIPTVLFFDEYTNAPDALQQLAYSPFNERKLYGVSFDYSLERPKGLYSGFSKPRACLYVFGAGNRVEDETGAREMVYASKTRVFTVDIDVSAEQWLRWAEQNGVHSTVRAFIMANPDALIERPSTGTACPREWANLSAAMYAGIPYNIAAHGTVRGKHEAKFCAFFQDSDLCPTIKDIVEGRAKKAEPVHLAAFSAVLAQALIEDKAAVEHFPLVYRWIGEQSPECEVVFARYVLNQLGPQLVSNPECMSLLIPLAEKVGVR